MTCIGELKRQIARVDQAITKLQDERYDLAKQLQEIETRTNCPRAIKAISEFSREH